MFAPAHLLRDWGAQRPSNNGKIDWSVIGKTERLCYTEASLLYLCTLLLLDYELNGTWYILVYLI